MTQGLESTAAVQWVYSTLAGDATLAGYLGGLVAPRIFDGVAPLGTITPWVTYQMLSSVDTDSVGGQGRVMSNMLWMILVAGEGTSYQVLDAPKARMDVLLHGARNVTNASGTVLACRRVQPIRQMFVEEGVQYRRVGGIYRIQAQ